MTRAKVHRPTARAKAENEPVGFSGEPLVHVNLKTGESSCRTKELWENQGWEKLSSREGEAHGRK